MIPNACVVYGSANFTHNSMDNCLEACTFTRAKLVTTQYDELFFATWKHARPLDQHKLQDIGSSKWWEVGLASSVRVGAESSQESSQSQVGVASLSTSGDAAFLHDEAREKG